MESPSLYRMNPPLCLTSREGFRRGICVSVGCLLMVVCGIDVAAFGQEGAGPGRGPGFGRGQGFGQGQGFGRGFRGGRGAAGNADAEGEDRFEEDHDVLHYLLDQHEKIRRTIEDLDNGVRTVTESDDPEVADKLKEHVEWMAVRVEKVDPIRMRDPLFREIFKHAKEIEIRHDETEKGVVVTETSKNPYVVKLIQEHAKVVSKFVEHGHDEAHKNHEVPEKMSGDAKQKEGRSENAAFPMIEGHGSIVRLPDAAQQPRAGTKICIDLVAKGEPDKVNPGLEKAARYLNIYSGAGEHPVEAQFAMVIHGDALSIVLDNDSYSAKMSTEGNPNLELLKQFREAGVQIFVCGQSLSKAGYESGQVVSDVEVAVSALTANINHQIDGFIVTSVK